MKKTRKKERENEGGIKKKEQTCECMDGWLDRQLGGWTDLLNSGCMNRQSEGWLGRVHPGGKEKGRKENMEAGVME